jgi:hypothetical protein
MTSFSSWSNLTLFFYWYVSLHENHFPFSSRSFSPFLTSYTNLRPPTLMSPFPHGVDGYWFLRLQIIHYCFSAGIMFYRPRYMNLWLSLIACVCILTVTDMFSFIKKIVPSLPWICSIVIFSWHHIRHVKTILCSFSTLSHDTTFFANLNASASRFFFISLI